MLSNIDEDANFTGLEDGKLTKLLYSKFTFIENAVAFLCFTGMLLAVFNVNFFNDFGKSLVSTLTIVIVPFFSALTVHKIVFF